MKKSKLQHIRDIFYYKDGKPDLISFGLFNIGLTQQEVKDYIIVRAGTLNIKKFEKKINELARGSTCPMVTFKGKSYCLFYRHDIEHYCDVVFNNAPYVMD